MDKSVEKLVNPVVKSVKWKIGVEKWIAKNGLIISWDFIEKVIHMINFYCITLVTTHA